MRNSAQDVLSWTKDSGISGIHIVKSQPADGIRRHFTMDGTRSTVINPSDVFRKSVYKPRGITSDNKTGHVQKWSV